MAELDVKLQEQQLMALLGLERRPVGVRFCASRAAYDASPFRQPTYGLPYCTAVAKAGAGHCYKLDVDHCRCGAASTALGLAPVTAERRSGQRYAAMGVYRDGEISRQVAQDMVYCQEPVAGVEISPLSQCNHLPDMVLVIAPPGSAMRLLQGYAYHYGQLKDIKMAGMCGICQECTSYPYVKGDMNVSLLCSGTRCVGRWQRQELGMGIPYAQLASVIDGIWRTVDAMETDGDKRAIVERFAALGLQPPPVTYGHHYYNGCYGTPATFRKRAEKENQG